MCSIVTRSSARLRSALLSAVRNAVMRERVWASLRGVDKMSVMGPPGDPRYGTGLTDTSTVWLLRRNGKTLGIRLGARKRVWHKVIRSRVHMPGQLGTGPSGGDHQRVEHAARDVLVAGHGVVDLLGGPPPRSPAGQRIGRQPDRGDVEL